MIVIRIVILAIGMTVAMMMLFFVRLLFVEMPVRVESQLGSPFAPQRPELPLNALGDAFRNIFVDGMGPCRLLYEKSTEVEVRLFMPENVDGMLPERLLWERLRFSRLLSLPKLEGIDPESELLLRSRNNCRLRLPSWKGISPVNWLWLKFIAIKLEKSPNHWGILPLSVFADKSTFWSFDRLLILEGITPDNWLLLKLRLNTNPESPRGGMVPLKLLEDNLRSCNWVSFPSSLGISPEILFSAMFNIVSLVQSPHSGDISPEN